MKPVDLAQANIRAAVGRRGKNPSFTGTVKCYFIFVSLNPVKMTRVSYFKPLGFVLIPLSLAVLPIEVTAFLLAAVVVLLSCIAVHIFSKCRSESHTFRSLLQNYQAVIFLWIFGWRARKRLERESKDCSNVQEKLLMEILNNNKNTVYGREYNFESIKSSKDFMQAHPLTTKSHYKEYVGKCGIY